MCGGHCAGGRCRISRMANIRRCIQHDFISTTFQIRMTKEAKGRVTECCIGLNPLPIPSDGKHTITINIIIEHILMMRLGDQYTDGGTGNVMK